MEASSHLDVTHGNANVSGVNDGKVEDDGFPIVGKVVQIQVGQFPHLLLLLQNIQPCSSCSGTQVYLMIKKNDEFSLDTRLVSARSNASTTMGRAQAIRRRG